MPRLQILVCSMLLLCLATSSLGKKYLVLNTTDKSFNDIMFKFNDHVTVTPGTESADGKSHAGFYTLSGTCNTCTIDPKKKTCGCTKIMCFRQGPSEQFVCDALGYATNLEQFRAVNKGVIKLNFTLKDGTNHWIQFLAME